MYYGPPFYGLGPHNNDPATSKFVFIVVLIISICVVLIAIFGEPELKNNNLQPCVKNMCPIGDR